MSRGGMWFSLDFRDVIQRGLARWASKHPVIWFALRMLWWLTVHPLQTLGMLLAVWLMLKGWWPPLAIFVGVLLATLRVVVRWSRLVANSVADGLRLRDILTRMSRWRDLQQRWQDAAYHAGIMDKRGENRIPRLLNADVNKSGDQITADVACGTVGITADKVAKSTEVIAATVGCRKVVVTPGNNPGFAHLQFNWGDPLSGVVDLSRLALPPRNRLSFGVTEHDEPATIAKYISLLICGVSGSGKSGVVWALLASALADGVPFRLWVLDPTGGVELHALNGSPLVRAYADRPSSGEEVIKSAHASMEKRLKHMSGTARMHTPTPEEPWEILVIDELLLMGKVLAKGSSSPLGEILTVGRKAAWSVWGLAQLTQKTDIGSMRDLFPQTLCLRTPGRSMTDALLGDGAEASGARCSRIPQSTPGVGYASLEGTAGYPRFRTAWVSDTDTRLIAARRLPEGVPTRGTDKPELEEQPHVMYGWYSDTEELLYVGISNNGGRRAMEHLADKSWAQEPGVSMRVLDRFDTRSQALEAEREAIQTQSPLHNIQHNGTRTLYTP